MHHDGFSCNSRFCPSAGYSANGEDNVEFADTSVRDAGCHIQSPYHHSHFVGFMQGLERMKCQLHEGLSISLIQNHIFWKS